MHSHYSGIGFVGGDARINEARTQALFQIAITPARRRDDPEPPKPFWIPCVVFGERVRFAERHIRKGAQVLVSGVLVVYAFLPEDQDTPLDRFEVQVDRIEVIRRGRVSRGGDGEPTFEGS